jgi:large subunit ribosomal protein L24
MLRVPALSLRGPPLARFFDSRGPKLARPQDVIRTWKVKVGDEVEVISGKDKKKRGRVIQTDYRRNMVKVEGCNLRTLRKKGQDPVKIEKKIHYSNVNLLDPVYQEKTRVALRFTDDGEAVRIAKKSGQMIPWPDDLRKQKEEERLLDAPVGPKDTDVEAALQKTYDGEKDALAMRMLREALTKYNHSRGD